MLSNIWSVSQLPPHPVSRAQSTTPGSSKFPCALERKSIRWWFPRGHQGIIGSGEQRNWVYSLLPIMLVCCYASLTSFSVSQSSNNALSKQNTCPNIGKDLSWFLNTLASGCRSWDLWKSMWRVAAAIWKGLMKYPSSAMCIFAGVLFVFVCFFFKCLLWLFVVLFVDRCIWLLHSCFAVFVVAGTGSKNTWCPKRAEFVGLKPVLLGPRLLDSGRVWNGRRE